MAKIFILEDQDELRENLRLFLARLGHEVRHSDNGKEALSLLQADTPDVLVTDLFVPGKDGIEIIQEVRSKCPHVRIIAISGGLRGEVDSFLTMARRLGVDATLEKPFSLEEFHKVLTQVLATKTESRP